MILTSFGIIFMKLAHDVPVPADSLPYTQGKQTGTSVNKKFKHQQIIKLKEILESENFRMVRAL